ncbi:hypothetical protein EDC96DRAFT_530892 [Choanephora cucurbitarum]|nr:hypothetical protein EDC96DRAFT_530892 [Choanephora cucurbitarum]
MRFITITLALVAPFLLTSSAASIGRRDEQKVSAITIAIGGRGLNGPQRGIRERRMIDSPDDNLYNPSGNVDTKAFNEQSLSFASSVQKRAPIKRASTTDSTEQDDEVYIPPTKRAPIKRAPIKLTPTNDSSEQVQVAALEKRADDSPSDFTEDNDSTIGYATSSDASDASDASPSDFTEDNDGTIGYATSSDANGAELTEEDEAALH